MTAKRKDQQLAYTRRETSTRRPAPPVRNVPIRASSSWRQKIAWRLQNVTIWLTSTFAIVVPTCPIGTQTCAPNFLKRQFPMRAAYYTTSCMRQRKLY